jgi:protocatechuate 3,4-dioxygenase beta subunit
VNGGLGMLRIVAIIPAAILSIAPAAYATSTGCVQTIDGEAVVGAQVAVYRSEGIIEMYKRLAAGIERPVLATTRSNVAGRYLIEHDLGPLDEIIVTAEGYVPVGSSSGVIVMAPATMITGRITSGGKPVAGATVIWLGILQGRWVGITDQNGEYQVPDRQRGALPKANSFSRAAVVLYSPSGDFPVAVRSYGDGFDIEIEPFVTVKGTALDQHGKVVEGAEILASGMPVGTTSGDGSFEIELPPQQQSIELIHSGGVAIASTDSPSLDLEVTIKPGLILRGRVAHENGTGIPFARVFLTLEGFTVTREVVTRADGRFEMTQLPAGQYYSRATISGPYRPFVSASLDLGNVTTVEHDLIVEASVVHTGQVVDSRGRPVSGAAVYPGVGARSCLNVVGIPYSGYHLLTDCNGRFEIAVEQKWEQCRLLVVKMGLPFAVSDRLESYRAGGDMTIRLGTGVSLKGRVQAEDGSPIANVGVAVISAGHLDSIVFASNFFGKLGTVNYLYWTEADGTFDIAVAEGEYDLLFERRGYILESLESIDAVPDREPIVVTMQRSSTLSGRVVEGHGKAVERAYITAVGVDSHKRETGTRTDGSFQVDTLRPGAYEVHMRDPVSGIELFQGATVPGSDVVFSLPEIFTLFGRVLDQKTGEPVQDAEVLAKDVGRVDKRRRPVTTDGDGRFEVTGLEAGAYQLRVRSSAYLEHTSHEVRVSSDSDIVTEELEIDLEPGLRLAGRVVAEDGTPVAEAEVEVKGVQLLEKSGLTDESGRFLLEGIRMGQVRVSAYKEGLAPTLRELQLEDHEENLVLTLEDGLELTGRVEDTDGNPLHQAWVRAKLDASEDQEQVLGAELDIDGSFRFAALGRGVWLVRADAPGYVRSKPIRVIPEQQPRLTISLNKAKSGTVVGTVSGLEDPRTGSIEIIEAFTDRRLEGTLDDAGGYRIESVTAGWADAYARSVHLGRDQSRSRRVDVPVDSEVRVDFDFGADSPVTGRVTRHGEPVVGATISGRSIVETTTENDGFYRTEAPDGLWTITIRTAAGQSGVRWLYVDGPTVLDIDLSGQILAGRILDSTTSEPVAGADLMFDARSSDASHALSDQDGAFFIESDIEPGPLLLWVTHPDYFEDLQFVEIIEGARKDIEIVLEKVENIRVKLVNGLENGKGDSDHPLSNIQ